MEIKVERQIDEQREEDLGVDEWSPWSKEESRFDWSYSDTETCLILEGEVTVQRDNGESVTIREGDLAQFPEGLSCVWDVTSDLEKVFSFDDVEVNPDESV